jgi:hypothetical protein
MVTLPPRLGSTDLLLLRHSGLAGFQRVLLQAKHFLFVILLTFPNYAACIERRHFLHENILTGTKV